MNNAKGDRVSIGVAPASTLTATADEIAYAASIAKGASARYVRYGESWDEAVEATAALTPIPDSLRSALMNTDLSDAEKDLIHACATDLGNAWGMYFLGYAYSE